MIQVPAVLERCAGIDIGKRMIAVSVITGPADSEGEVESREYGTTVPQLEELRKWLHQKGCTSVAMESTGPYWIPVKNVLEGHVEIVLVCPRQHHPKRGDKTDLRDSKNLAHLHRHGLLQGSFLPSGQLVELRDLTRRRKKLRSNLSAEKNRIQKVLEAASVKIGNVASDVFGVTGQAIVHALLNAEEIEAEQVANLAKARLRQRLEELTETLKGDQMTEHHRWMIRQSVEHAVLLDKQLEDIEQRIEEKLKPFEREKALLETIPGVKAMTAACVLAEVGPTMEPFASAKHLTSWAGLCPGNNRSAGKSKKSSIKKANRFLIASLHLAGKATARKQGSSFARKYHRFMGKLGVAKARVAIARHLLVIVYHVLSTGQPYREPDAGQMHELEKRKLIQHHSARLRQLGADEDAIQEIVGKMLETAAPTPPPREPEDQTRVKKVSPGKVCRGLLGFRARQTRPQEYSVVKHPPGKAPSQGRPKKTVTAANQPKPPEPSKPKTKEPVSKKNVAKTPKA